MRTIEAVVGVINGLTSSDPKQRERSADEVTDILGGFGPWENDLVSRLLSRFG